MLNTSGDGTGTNFYFDYQDGEYGYNTSPLRGADTFSPFKSGGEIILLASNLTKLSYNVTSDLHNYAELTVNNFFCTPVSVSTSESAHGSDTPSAKTVNVNFSYNASTGVISGTLSVSSTKGKTTCNGSTKVNLYYTSTPLP